MFIRDASKFSGKYSSGNAKNEISMACYTALHRMMKLLLHNFTLIIHPFRGLVYSPRTAVLW